MRSADALNAFRRSAKKAKPTKAHRPALWECMLGTIYACNAAGEVRYFDYDYDAAMAHIGPVVDVRVHRLKDDYYDLRLQGDSYMHPRRGRLVWFVKREASGA